jgi:hypothetical protein
MANSTAVATVGVAAGSAVATPAPSITWRATRAGRQRLFFRGWDSPTVRRDVADRFVWLAVDAGRFAVLAQGRFGAFVLGEE